MQKFNHSFDLAIDAGSDVETLSRSAFFADDKKQDDGSFDCAGSVGTAGSFGGTLGTFGTFGCCC
jgi:hypothetical protein